MTTNSSIRMWMQPRERYLHVIIILASLLSAFSYFLLSLLSLQSTVCHLPPPLSDSAVHFPDSGYYACEIRDNRFLVKIRRSERALLEQWHNKAIQSREKYMKSAEHLKAPSSISRCQRRLTIRGLFVRVHRDWKRTDRATLCKHNYRQSSSHKFISNQLFRIGRCGRNAWVRLENEEIMNILI